MENYLDVIIFAASFAVIALASRQIGHFFADINLPLISGFLLAGMLAGPFVLGLIPAEAIPRLRFVDEISLAVIAFAAGSELYLKELRSRFKSIAWVTVGQIGATFAVGSATMFLLADYIPFLQTMPTAVHVAVSLLAGAILVARSPSSAIAVINELRAKGPFTQTVLGVTVVIDVAVIVLFAVNSEIADALLANLDFDLGFLVLLLVELSLSFLLGYLLGKLLQLILSFHLRRFLKIGLILLVGYGVFVLSFTLRDLSHQNLPFEILLEPLLICMVGSFLVTNRSNYRPEFHKILHDIGPPIYVAFFTLTGASLALDVIADAWLVALALFVARLAGMFIGAFGGGLAAGDPAEHNRLGWMAYVTQAGVGLGLAKEVAVEFPEWGTAFATVMISVIVLNQVVGPPFLKWVLKRVGEAHPRAKGSEFDGVRDAIIFGLEGQSLALARQLRMHGWQVKLASRNASTVPEGIEDADVEICPMDELNLKMLQQLEAEHVDAIVAMLSDEENYRVCELAYEHFGVETMVVRLHDPTQSARFHKLGALVADPATAFVGVLEHMVRSPSAASLLLGMKVEQDIVEVEVRDPSLHGVAVRDLQLPLDTLILSVNRDGHMLISHGYTQLQLGDRVTVVGSQKSLDEVMLRFRA